MAKGKNLNPADAYRKAQRKKEVEKNKAQRSKAREISTVKKDTSGYEEEIQRLEEQQKTQSLDKSQKARLTDLKAEVDRIKAAKEAFVEAHPEQRKLVYRTHNNQPRADAASEDNEVKKRKLFGKDGLPLHPERSIYYDPVMNPYGVPPPGMPYIEKQEENGDVEEDMVPAEQDELDEDPEDADIPLPPGPPPVKNQPPLPLGAPPHGAVPLLMHGLPTAALATFPGPPNYPIPVGMPMPYPFPPASMPQGSIPPPPPPAPYMVAAPATYAPPPSMFPCSTQAHPLPPPPPARPPPVQAPPQEYTVTTPLPPSQLPPSSATISAPAALRDLKAEATAFVPSAVKRKQAGGAQK